MRSPKAKTSSTSRPSSSNQASAGHASGNPRLASIAPDWELPLRDGRIARLVMTDRRHGNLAVHQDGALLSARRAAVVDAPWTWLHQVHGARVIAVDHAGHGAGEQADAAWTTATGAPLAVQVADCAPVAMIGDGSSTAVLGVAHAGWRGLAAGVLQQLADAMSAAGAAPSVAVLGVCISAAAYEVGQEDLDAVAAALGPDVRAVTAAGTPALDVRAAVRAAVAAAGIETLIELDGCTALDHADRWSHRARGDTERQALVAWMEDS